MGQEINNDAFHISGLCEGKWMANDCRRKEILLMSSSGHKLRKGFIFGNSKSSKSSSQSQSTGLFFDYHPTQ